MSGAEQSPIDLTKVVHAELDALELRRTWKEGPVRVVKREKIEFADGGYLTIDGVRFVLKYGHLHRRSEHRVNGEDFDMEIHIVHEAADKRLAVVGIFVECGEQQNEALGRLLSDSPPETFDPRTLLPEDLSSYYRYAGSLTTSPYSEIVTWSVLATPIPATQAQLNLCPGKARPLQPTHRRYVLFAGLAKTQ